MWHGDDLDRRRAEPGATHRGREEAVIDLPTEELMSGEMLRGSLDALVRLIERVAPGMRGSILLLEGEHLHHGAAPHLPREYCAAIDGLRIGPVTGSCGTAAYLGERVVVRDIENDPLWADFRHLARPHDLAACWSTPILDTDGQVLGTFAMYYDEPREPDATELELADTAAQLAGNAIARERAERALRARVRAVEQSAEVLRESEARFHALAEAIPVHVWTAGPDGGLDFVTKRVARYFGKPVEALLGDGWTEEIHPDDIERVARRWSQSLHTGQSYEVEFRIFSAETGQYRWHLVRADAVTDAEGRVVRWYGSNTDIEEKKRLEATVEQALAEAERANRTKANFLAVMSHELRTPLNAIGGYASLLLDGIPTPPSEAQRNFLQRIARSQEHLLGLIESVLTHAKIEAGKETYRVEPVRMQDVIASVDSITAPQRAERGLAFDHAGADPALTVRGDGDKVVQIVLNLVSNAIKFTPPGGSITVSTHRPDAARVAITVRDTGIGMTPDQVAAVFEPFTQFDSALAREHRGTGLGMPISREFARAMGGDLTVESVPGAGSAFTLTLPLELSTPDVTPAPPRSSLA